MVYSFLNVTAFMAGPGLGVNLGAGSGSAEEGIKVEAVDDKNVMTIGADGVGQHSLVASNAAKVTIQLLRTSPVNTFLMLAYDAQSASSSLWGQNLLTIVDTGRGDLTVIQSMAFKKKPALGWAKEAGLIEWEFDGITANSVLGKGQ